MASRLQDVILRGLASARPLATSVAPGTLYYSTDGSTTERSNGTIWETYADSPAAGTTGINQLTGAVLAGPGVGSQVTTIAPLAIGTPELADDAVTAAKLADTIVVPGSYTNANLTVDQQGRLTAVANGSTGITQLTGDVLAGPGSGSQVATIGAGVVTPAMLAGGSKTGSVSFVIANASPLVVGYKAIVRIPVAVTVVRWSIMADVVGNIRFNVYSNSPGTTYPPATSIVAAAFPELTGGATRFLDNTTLTGWTLVIPALNCIGVEVLTTSGTIKTVTLQLDYTRN